MNLRLALALVIITFSHSIFSSTINIGCATRCDAFFKYALKKVAKRHGVQVRILDVSRDGNKVDWSKYHGIIFPGGADINPAYYLSSIEPELQDYTRSLDHLVNYSEEGKRRDPIEFNMLKEYFSKPELKDLPILGVCRGMQMLAVSQGVPLYVDIKTELGIKNRRYLYDRIHLETDESLLNDLFSFSFNGFKRHHQGIRVPYFLANASRWPHLKITSFSNEGRIAESLEFPTRPILGVQFHPENDFGFERNKIFGWLLSKAKERMIKFSQKQSLQ